MNKEGVIRVALVPPERWGPSQQVFVPGTEPDPSQIYQEMRGHGVDFELIDPGAFFATTVGKLHPMYSGLDPLRALKLLTRYRDVDLLLSVFEASCTLPLLLRRVFGYRPKIAMWDLIPEEQWLPRSVLQRISLPRVDHLFLLSEYHNEYLERKFHRRGTVIWQHVDTDFYTPAPAVARGPILAIGDDHGRDYDTFIEAVCELDVDVVLKTRRTLRIPSGCKARFAQIQKRLTFIELRDLYAAARVVVVPLHQTLNASGVGSVLEAMAMGKPMIVSDNPPIRDYFVPGKTAVVVPSHDPARLRDAIRELVTDDARCAALGTA
ncbi:MAG: glycosyltransferase family 4 protein, partial [Fimbriimonadaceae bacterium]